MNEQLAKLFRSAAVYGFGRILGKVISFLLIPFYTHYFSAAEYGVMEILNLAAMIASVLLAPGLSTAVMRLYYDTEDRREQKLVISTGLLMTLLVGGLVSLLVVAFPDGPSRMLLGSAQYRTLVRLVACSFFFSFSADTGWVYLRSQQRSSLYTFLTQGFLLASVSLNVYLVAVRKLGVAGSFWANIVTGAVVWAVLLAMTFRDVGARLSPKKAWDLLKFGAPLFTVWMAAFVVNYSDRFFLQRFRGIEAVGVYAVGYKFAYVLSLLVVQPFQLMWEPQSYEISKREDSSSLFSRIFTLYAAALIAMAFFLSLFIREIFEGMVDPKFLNAWRFVPLVAFAYVVQGLALYFEAGLLIRKKNGTLSLIGITSTALCLLLNLALIRIGGAWGAVWATFLSFTFVFAASCWCSLRVYPFACDFRLILAMLGASVGLLLLGYAAGSQSLSARIVIKLALSGAFIFLLARLQLVPRGIFASLRRDAAQWARARLSPVFGLGPAGLEPAGRPEVKPSRSE